MTDVRELAAEAYRFGYALVENYRTLYAQAVDADDPRYVGGFGHYRHYSTPARPENTDIVTPNNDTPYSWGWFDLRAEPWVVSVPAVDRYYILPFHQLDTVYAGYVGAVTTGQGAGSYLLAGPGWDGTVPDGIAGVVRSATDVVGCLGRTASVDGDLDALQAIQRSYEVEPLSVFAGVPSPDPAPAIDWPVWDEQEHTHGVGFFTLLDFLLQLAPVADEDAEVRARLAEIGLTGEGTFDPAGREAELLAGLADGAATLTEHAERTTTSVGLFGLRAEMAGRYDQRNLGAMKGIFGLPTSEAWYGGWLVDSAGEHPVGAHLYTVTFGPGELPDVAFFWSATMYRLPERLLVANPIDRYSIGDRTPGIAFAEDGSLTLLVQHDAPADTSNWIPSPEGPFTLVVRGYGGGPSLRDGTYRLPPLQRA